MSRRDNMHPSVANFSMDFFSLKDKVAMVTGGNTNLGMAYAVAFAKAGADLFIPHFEDDVSEVKEAIEKEGRRVEFLQGDLTDKEYRKAVIEKCLEVYGKIDILVNNAGISFHAPIEEFKDEWYQRGLELNLNVVYYMSREVGLVMKKQGGGKIINIGSALSFTASARGTVYPISKHGVIGVTRSIAAAFLHDNVQCNAICPGFFKSPINKGGFKGDTDRVSPRLPGNEWGEFGDLMGTAVFLASKASDYVNGTFVIVDGGFAANYI
jgi:2-deoxy-D-gluconate 3-dehydrogenase